MNECEHEASSKGTLNQHHRAMHEFLKYLINTSAQFMKGRSIRVGNVTIGQLQRVILRNTSN